MLHRGESGLVGARGEHLEGTPAVVAAPGPLLLAMATSARLTTPELPSRMQS